MSGSSDSDEFYDALDDSPNRVSDHNKRRPKTLTLTPSKSESDFQTTLKLEEKRHGLNSFPARAPSSVAIQNAGKEAPVFEKNQSKRHKLRELRHRMQTEDEEVLTNAGTSPTNSQTSSFDGVFPGTETKSSHPFRIIEHDALSLHSLTSLGRIGRLLSSGQSSDGPPPGSTSREPATSGDQSNGGGGGSTTTLRSPSESRGDDPSTSFAESSSSSSRVVKVEESTASRDRNLQEPDVIASTKASVAGPGDSARVPVAPPRRKKRAKANILTCPPPEPSALHHSKKDESKPTQLSVSVDEPNTNSFKRGATLPSPASTIESITREFENSLDIKAATQGQYLVKSQENDENQSRSARTSGRNSSTYPLGSGNVSSGSGASSRERRKSAGDEQTLSANQLNMFVRTRTDSGKPLSDLVTVLNLDTGERVPLSIAEDKLPQCINPLSLHIMRLTSEYVSNTSLEKAQRESDDDSIDLKKSGSVSGDGELDGSMVKRKTALFRKFLGSTVKKTMIKARTIGRHSKEESNVVVADNPTASSGEQFVKIKASNSHKGPYEFEHVQHVQDLNGEHIGPIWCMKFSSCGRLLATAGQDRVLRVWVVRSANPYFQEVRQKYAENKNNSPTPSLESIVTQVPVEETKEPSIDESPPELEAKAPFMSKPLCTYSGHTSDLLDVAWSKNYFILTSSMDKTVRLWHISRKECLCCFQHIDCVSAICFHPRDDRYFLSGSLDGKLRLWYIPDKKVAVWNEIDGPTKLITAANFCENGKLAVVGSYDGRCIFYNNMDLKYHTTINVRSSRGKNTRGRKISGIEQMPGQNKILITSNDSRIRLYDVGELIVSVKYKGYCNFSSQIKASFSHDGKFIVSGSENQCIYIWKSHHDYSKFSSVRRDRNDYWEGIKVHNAVVTCAIFSPNPDLILRQIEELEGNATSDQGASGYVLVSADFNGCIKVFINKTKPKHSSLPASALA